MNFLFRFRDLVADTIAEHQKIISQHGMCWWGWWQRPSEENREDIWLDLQDRLSRENEIEVGLFDSGTGAVYSATVSKVIVPMTDCLDGAGVTPPFEEINLIPYYYRSSPFNKAWLKIVKIKNVACFFRKYSFSEAPKLPNYSDSILNNLKDKLIVSSEELRGMDTTIWRIRPSITGDQEKELIFTTPALPGAESDEIVKTRGNSILHLTDTHFAVGNSRKQHVWKLERESNSGTTMADAIVGAIHDKDIGLVIVTGDLTFRASEEEFTEARLSLMQLLGKLKLSTDHLVVIPGNHDIAWTDDGTYSDISDVRHATPEVKKNYEKFYRDLFRHEPSKHLAMARRFSLPNGMTLEVCALNSSSLGTGKNFLAGMGRVDEAAFTDVAKTLSWNGSASMTFRILALHHHLTVTEDVEDYSGYSHGYGMAVDAIRIQRKAATMGVHLALHGHKHRAFVWRSMVYELPEHTHKNHRLGGLSILGGGSAGSSEVDSGFNYFNVVNFTPTQLGVKMYRSKRQSSFDHFQTWSAKIYLSDEKNSLMLDDWDTGN